MQCSNGRLGPATVSGEEEKRQPPPTSLALIELWAVTGAAFPGKAKLGNSNN